MSLQKTAEEAHLKVPTLLVVALVAVVLAGVAQAGTINPLYLAHSQLGNYEKIVVIQGNVVSNSFLAHYSPEREMPIAVYGDVRTAGDRPAYIGGQYTLDGRPTGFIYNLPSVVSSAFDSTTDGTHNYLVDYDTGDVFQTARDFTNPTKLFQVTAADHYAGITYNPENQSLWLSADGSSMVTNYSLSGALLKSFDVGHMSNDALAYQPYDGSLWLVNNQTGDLEQYNLFGKPLSLGPHVGVSFGAEFDLAGVGVNPAPEPGTLIMFGSSILGLAGVLRRRINL